MKNKIFSFKIKKINNPNRLDLTIKKKLKILSRNKIIQLIKNKNVLINKIKTTKPNKKININDKIIINYILPNNKLNISKKKLDIIYEDIDLLIINKPAFTLVHPTLSKFNYNNTIVNQLMFYYFKTNKLLPRYGLIHRLDKDTTGILIIAKNIKSYTKLINNMKLRKIKRIYTTIVYGKTHKYGYINKSISRHPYKRTTMHINNKGKEAITYYKIIEQYKFSTLLKIILQTGRTHQIRLHMKYINHPIIGDKIYTNKDIKNYNYNITNINIKNSINNLKRQALHATTIIFKHPINKNYIKIESPIPKDMQKLINIIRLYN